MKNCLPKSSKNLLPLIETLEMAAAIGSSSAAATAEPNSGVHIMISMYGALDNGSGVGIAAMKKPQSQDSSGLCHSAVSCRHLTKKEVR